MDIFLLFIKIGTISFRGSYAAIAIMKEEVVFIRKLITLQLFLDIVSSTHIIPGIKSLKVALHIGKILKGYVGLFIAGVAYLLPSISIALIIGISYHLFDYSRVLNIFMKV